MSSRSGTTAAAADNSVLSPFFPPPPPSVQRPIGRMLVTRALLTHSMPGQATAETHEYKSREWSQRPEIQHSEIAIDIERPSALQQGAVLL
ncbi:hypothetical protein V5799_011522 [Amblyomma americanum]|uniref:Uncharacterized protein n=1 Tax=Amblyomma americanum TaxID=6943 RepID=A0AAQ4EGU9_AMBAM